MLWPHVVPPCLLTLWFVDYDLGRLLLGLQVVDFLRVPTKSPTGMVLLYGNRLLATPLLQRGGRQRGRFGVRHDGLGVRSLTMMMMDRSSRCGH